MALRQIIRGLVFLLRAHPGKAVPKSLQYRVLGSHSQAIQHGEYLCPKPQLT